MEGSYFPEDKDLAHKIMMDLSNNDLVKICATNKRMYDVCNNYPDFWRNKFVKDYGEHAAQYKPENRSWKTHYMRVFIDLQKYKKNPIDFFQNIAWKENVNQSFFIDRDNKRIIPLKDAPDWVMENLYLLNIDELKIKPSGGSIIKYQNIKPIDVLQKQPMFNDPTYFLFGFRDYYNYDNFYVPQYAQLDSIQRWLKNPIM